MRFTRKTAAPFVAQIIASNQKVYDNKGKKIYAQNANFFIKGGQIIAVRKPRK